MSESRSTRRRGGAKRDTVTLRLYIADLAPNSTEALSNIKAICEGRLRNRHTLEIVDVLVEPMRALNDKILVTPTLLRVTPLPEVKIIGNLSQTETVMYALGLAKTGNEEQDA